MKAPHVKGLNIKIYNKKITTIIASAASVLILLVPSLAVATAPSTQFTDPNLTPNDGFGYALSISSDGNVAVVGSPESPGGGTAYVFVNNGGIWTEAAQFIPSDLTSSSYFGNSVAITPNGQEVIVGANGIGKAYIFTASSEAWADANETTPVAELQENPDQTQTGDNFGWSVALSGDGTTALVGANLASQNNQNDVGSAYIFTQSNGVWNTTPTTELTPSDDTANNNFGYSVALSTNGSTALIGAPGIGSTSLIGSAYLYNEPSVGGWATIPTMTQSQEISSNIGISGGSGDGEPQDLFGVSVALSGDGNTAVIGAQNHPVNGNDIAGAVYVYTPGNGGGLSLSFETLDPNGQFDDKFGSSVAIAPDGSSLLVGSPGYSNDVGQAYSYSPNNDGTGNWTQNNIYAPTSNNPDQKFGFSVALIANNGSDNVAFIGAPGSFSQSSSSDEDVATTAAKSDNSGTVYLFASPILSSFSPATVGEGSTVKIKGSNLLVGGIDSSVTWNGESLTVLKNTKKEITVAIPDNAPVGSGDLTVSNSNGTSSFSSPLSIAAPVITSVPKSGTIGSTITIKGQYLAGVTQVTFTGGVQATPVTVKDNSISVVVPDGTDSGTISVTAQNGTSVSAKSFTVK